MIRTWPSAVLLQARDLITQATAIFGAPPHFLLMHPERLTLLQAALAGDVASLAVPVQTHARVPTNRVYAVALDGRDMWSELQ